jgi:hypothetical protein
MSLDKHNDIRGGAILDGGTTSCMCDLGYEDVGQEDGVYEPSGSR